MAGLFEPFEVKGLTFKNRIVHAPTTMNMSDPLGHVTSQCTGAYEALARGGYSATIVGATCVRRDGLINERMLGLYDDTYIIGQRDLVEVIRHNDSLAGIQLFYGGLIPGLGATFPLPPGEGWIPGTVSWGPSTAYPLGNASPNVVPTEVYQSLVEDYAQGARRAQEAGYDFVSFHFCHGSLPHVTLSLLANVGRNDEYGDRFLFCEQIIERTQQLCGKEYPIVPRLCCDENYADGYDIAHFAENYAPRLHALGIAVLDCTFGSMLPARDRNPATPSADFIGGGFYVPNLINLDNICNLKARLIEGGIDMPLIGSCNLNTPDHLETMADAAEFVGVCRMSLDDPDFPNKLRLGRADEIRKSTRTGASLLQGNIFGKGYAGSAQNPSFGRDRDYRLRAAVRPNRIVVVGGGSGGMEYALTAQARGHDVTLFERSSRLGGVMDWAGNYRNLPNMESIRYQPDYHRRMIELNSIDVRLNVDATVADIVAATPDLVVIATGAVPIVPNAPGLREALDDGFAVLIDDVMARDHPADPGRSPIIFGAAEGIELALDLKREGRHVRLLDSAANFVPAAYIGSRSRHVMQWLAAAELKVESGVQLVEIAPGIVRVCHADGTAESIAADRLILSVGRRPGSALAGPLEARGLAVQVIGDARQPRSYGNAIHEAAYLARQV